MGIAFCVGYCQVDRKMLFMGKTPDHLIEKGVCSEACLKKLESAQQSVQEDEACACDQKYHGYTKHMDGSVTCNHCRKPRR